MVLRFDLFGGGWQANLENVQRSGLRAWAWIRVAVIHGWNVKYWGFFKVVDSEYGRAVYITLSRVRVRKSKYLSGFELLLSADKATYAVAYCHGRVTGELSQ